MPADKDNPPAHDDSTIRPRVATTLLALSMFFTGAAGFMFECVLSTVATYTLGNSIEQFSVTISLMMLMMGVAGFLQRRISDDRLIEKFLLVETSLALLGGYSPIAVYAAYGLMSDHFALVQYFFVTSIGFLIGLEIPLVLRINRRYVPALKSNIAAILSPDYIGAFLGALVWVYFLLKYYPLTEISFLVGGLNFAVAVVTFLYFMRHRLVAQRALSLALIAVTAGALGYGYTQNRFWNANLEQHFYDAPIVFSKTSKYQHLVLTASVNPTDYRLYINGNLQLSSLDEHIYHEQLVHPVMHLAKNRSRVLILGGGDGLALREVVKYPDVEHVTLVDIDPDMIDLAKNNEILNELNQEALRDTRVHARVSSAVRGEDRSTPVYYWKDRRGPDGGLVEEEVARVEVFTIDADRFIEEIAAVWDVIIVDFPDPNTVELVKLYSSEFYFKLKKVLAEEGMIAMQSTSPYHAKESFLCILRTVESAGFRTIPYHDNVPSFGDWGWVLAWKSTEEVSAVRDRISHMSAFEIDSNRLRHLTPEVFKSSLTFGKTMLESERSEINRLMQPVLLQMYLDESWEY